MYVCNAREILGGQVRMDKVKVAPGPYEYTAIDDCSRLVVAALYPKRTAANTLDYLDLVLDSIAVPIQCIQTDRGGEFIAFKVQLRLRELSIKYRPNKPASPHLNGKVERVQQTIQREFYANTDLHSADLAEELGVWLTDYNYQRKHGSLGTTPVERLCERMEQAAFWADVLAAYDPRIERFHERPYAEDQRLARLQQQGRAASARPSQDVPSPLPTQDRN